MTRKDLNVFLIKESYTELESVVEEDYIEEIYPLKKELGIEGKLFVGHNQDRSPNWLEWLQEGLEGDLKPIYNRSTRAVLVIKSNGRIFAFPFGHGRYMLIKKAIVQDFGIKIAMNLADPSSLSSIDTFRISNIIIRHRTQTSNKATIDNFNLDENSMFLQRLTAKPKDSRFGTSTTGRDSARFSFETNVAKLHELCEELCEIYQAETYKEAFGWYDQLRDITDPEMINKLDQELYEILEAGTDDAFHLAPPEIVDMEEIEAFSFTKGGERQEELSTKAYLEYFQQRDRDMNALKQHRLYAWYNDDTSKSWSLYNCIFFEFKEDDDVYVLANGLWFQIDENFAKQIETYLESIPDFETELPVSYEGENEASYNKKAAEELDYLCMDAEMIYYQGNQIEACDLLTPKQQFIHVKIWNSSSTLSHLFSQGQVSAENLLRSQEFREKTKQKQIELNKDFPLNVGSEEISPVAFEIVYAIIYKGKKPIHKRLPFFSKLTMKNAVSGLRALGFKVSKAHIEIVSEEKTNLTA
ncbi:MAG: TIGR04141 family sporadically distributed protein [Bacillota bacterium]|mgnify:CR=1 FL=1|nr:TIGR04141 family sporadically distributed protein [Bacillota bacterium]